MKKKGFTLIELLAVIVILAIIALIATPAVLNIIEDSKESAAKDSAMAIAKAAETYYISNVTLQGNEVGTVDLTDDTIQYKGEKPEKGYVEFDNKGNAYLKMYMNGYCIISDYDNTVMSEKMDSDECDATMTVTYTKYKDGYEILFDPVYNVTCETSIGSTTGTNNGCMKWYVFLDSESSSTVNLLLDHNTTGECAWNEDDGTTPDTVNAQLATDVEGWNIAIKSTARIISATEINRIAPTSEDFIWGTWDINNHATWYSLHHGSHTSYYGEVGTNKYAWLFSNTDGCEQYGCNKNDKGAFGYWTSDFVYYEDDPSAWTVSQMMSIHGVTGNNFYGVRPVITIPKSLLED